MLIPPRVTPYPKPLAPPNLITVIKVREVLKADWLYRLASPQGKARLIDEHLALH